MLCWKRSLPSLFPFSFLSFLQLSMQCYILGFLLRFRAFRGIYHSFLHLKKLAFCYVRGLFKGSAPSLQYYPTYNYAIHNHAMDTQEYVSYTIWSRNNRHLTPHVTLGKNGKVEENKKCARSRRAGHSYGCSCRAH